MPMRPFAILVAGIVVFVYGLIIHFNDGEPVANQSVSGHDLRTQVITESLKSGKGDFMFSTNQIPVPAHLGGE